ncbi:LuxR C-terminal-related transcriptional regulator [Paenibacillus glycanilyticus]|uniref:LuxR C-terminal-related transcriptional regulator n=1 Tax=Paenibacillus glycanilyticus TaxID=126569 RepID=UPI0020419E4F|nr:LuxR C-terminal-related transcriptional regulator [Paenibacillus glycanilyticus]MCM3626049.1 LuxR C-terminal-related transcriptional regulator [Paenibacillus glycanilyticus]
MKENLIVRERLMESLEQGMKGRMTTVCAPAGSGKSTLIGQWAQSARIRTAWVSLDERDNDIARFWRYVINAYMEAGPPALSDSLSAALALVAGTTVNVIMDTLLNELAAVQEQIALVLDDYHHVELAAIHNSLSCFIEYLPAHHRIIIASRETIAFDAAKWLARGERTDIGMQQLHFTQEETREFCRSAGIHLEQRQTNKLFEKTEGWVAGLQLASISLQAQQDIDRMIARFDGSHETVSLYLFQEVLDKLPSDLKDFLLQTSVFDRMDSEVCNRAFNRSDSREMLERLRALNLFVIPLDDHNGWFRYHSLFAEFLRNRLRSRSRQLWLDYHHAASVAFADRGLLDKAIDHAIAGERYKEAAERLEDYIQDALKQGELASLLERLQTVSEHIPLSARLLLYQSFAYFLTGQMFFAAETVEKLERKYEQPEYASELEPLQGGMLFLQSNLLFYTGRYVQWDSFVGYRLHGVLPEDPVFYSFNYNRIEPLVRRTAFGLKGTLSADTERIGQRFTAVLEQHGWGQSLINLYVVQAMCEGYYEWNRQSDSLLLVRKIEQSDRARQTAGLFVPSRITLARLHAAAGQFQKAHDAIEEAVRMAERLGEYHWLYPLRASLAHLYLKENNLAEAKAEISKLHLSDRIQPASSRWSEYTVYARILTAQGKTAEAIRQLELIKSAVEQEHCFLVLTEIDVVQALAEYQRGNRSAALQLVHAALLVGEANGYIRSFVDEGSQMKKLLHAYMEKRQREAGTDAMEDVSLSYVAKLLECFPEQEPPLLPAASLVEPLTEQESYILQLLDQGAPNKQIAAKLALTEGTVKVYLSRIYAKLGVSSRTQALAAARQLNGWRNSGRIGSGERI